MDFKDVNDNLECPYCNATNSGFSEILSEDDGLFSCFNCGEEIWENIPKRLLVYEAFYFVFNVLVFSIIIFISVNFFESYPEWRETTGFIFTFTVVIASLSLHEFFHSFFGFIFGDFSIFRKKYLRLNILQYLSGAQSFFIPGILFIFSGIAEIGAAVYVNRILIRRPILNFIVDISGVFSQVIFLFIIMYIINSEIFVFSEQLITLLHFSAGIQLLILIINLLPIPGLDGWNAIFCFLPFKNVDHYLSKYSTIFILGCFSVIFFIDDFGLFIFSPLLNLMEFVGINLDLWFLGFKHIQLIDFDTLDLIKDRIVNLFLNTVGK